MYSNTQLTFVAHFQIDIFVLIFRSDDKLVAWLSHLVEIQQQALSRTNTQLVNLQLWRVVCVNFVRKNATFRAICIFFYKLVSLSATNPVTSKNRPVLVKYCTIKCTTLCCEVVPVKSQSTS